MIKLSDDQSVALRGTILSPSRFAKGILGHSLWPMQRDILEAVAARPRVAVKACHSSGKCLHQDDILTLADGRLIPAKELVGKSFQLLTLADGIPTPVTASAEWNKVEPTFEIQTTSGRRISRNSCHPLWSASIFKKGGHRPKISVRGWTHIHDLTPGDYVAVSEELPAFGSTPLPLHHVKILAYLIGDGGMTHSQISFAQMPGPQLEEMRECVELAGAELHQYPWAKHICEWYIRRPGGRSSGNTPNPVRELLSFHGLIGKHGRDKRVPQAIYSLPKEQLSVFLSRLFSTDGAATSKGPAVVGFGSASRGLVEDIQHLLLRFGISSRIYHKSKVNCWELVIARATDVLRFCDEIGIYGKESQVSRCRAVALSTRQDTWLWKKAPVGTRWEEVKSITPVGIAPTVAVEVPEYHTFLTSFYEHNTFLAAEAALWWVTRFPDGIVVTTAPTWVQVEKLLWGEIHKDIASAKLKYPEPNKTELKLGPNRYAMGLSTNEGVRFQGFHGKILIIIDEAPGVRPDIWESIEGIRAGGDVRILALGNPVVAGGEFYDAFTTNRAGWKTFTIDAFGTPNLYEPSLARHLTEAELLALPDEQLDYAPKPYLTLRRWVKEKLVEWGPDSPVYQSRVRGQFPKQSQDSLIGIADLEAANLRPAIDRGGAVCAGLDVAGPGEDETSLTLRCGDSIIRTKSWAISDPRGEVVQELLPYLERLEEVNVDSNGIGYYIALHLQDVMKEKLPARWRGVVNFVNVGEGTEEPDMYVNLKAELYWRLKMRFAKQHVAGLVDETAISQLGTIRYRINSKGKIEIESKDDMRKRGAKSPDRGESIMLAFAAIKETAAARQPTEAPLSMDRLSAWSVGSTTF